MTRLIPAVLFLLAAISIGCVIYEKDTLVPGSPAGVITVDFLADMDLEANALAPQVVAVDFGRNRVFVACTNSSSVAVIEGGNYLYPTEGKLGIGTLPPGENFNVPVGSRMPRRLRDAGMKIMLWSGELLLLGDKQLIVVDPVKRTSRVIPLPGDYEAMAVYGASTFKWAMLVGRTRPDLAFVDILTEEVTLVPCMEPAPPLPFMAASAPPPIRFPFYDPFKSRIHVLDGIAAELITIDSKTLKVISIRKLPVDPVPRWHVAGGFYPQNDYIYMVLENERREAVCALAIDTVNGKDIKVDLPEKHTEPAGVNGDPIRGEVYIPYDNMKVIHVVTFGEEPRVEEIAVPDVGIDATAYDHTSRIMYAAGWKQAALYELDMKEKKRTLTVPFFPVFPHMNNMALNFFTRKLYVPSGSTAVNGTFGAAIHAFDTRRLDFSEIQTGWGPVSLVQKPGSDSFFVFGVEREFAEVAPDGSYVMHELPHPYPRQAILDPDGESVWVAYGPHSSWWPNYYINGTRTGIFKIDAQGKVILNRTTPKLVQGMLFDKKGYLWALQNTWGKQEPFLIAYSDVIGTADEGRKAWPKGWFDVRLPPKVDNECLLRLLALDVNSGLIYAGRAGNLSKDNGRVYAIEATTRTIKAEYEVSRTPTGMCVLPDRSIVYVANFDDDSISAIHARQGRVESIPVGKKPLAVAAHPGGDEIFVINHLAESLTRLDARTGRKKEIALPGGALPNNLLVDPESGKVYITAHGPDEARIYRFDPDDGTVATLLIAAHPYGEVSFDQANAAFGLRGQWGDGIFRITDMALDGKGRLWVSDYLGGRLWIVDVED
ncbi:MAG: YncE family protein [Planctomycetota bacterium]|jgi:DNA-binding beta-propeller fold protein YncE